VQERNEQYGYDALGQLTSAIYEPGASGAWDYDGAGNRSVPTGYSYDKLNRMTASPGGAVYQNDILGNRTWKNYGQSSVQRYVWDELGRLSSTCSTTQGAKYTYRVDGLRAKKVEGLTILWVDDESQQSQMESSGHYDEIWSVNKPTTRYYYDGQMGFEEEYTPAPGGIQKTVTRYALGARGIDGIEVTDPNQNKTASYPVYDGHGNMIATLRRTLTAPYFERINDRKYDAWGGIRTGTGPEQGYVANIGHRRDAESGLTYMRARYYEPGTGRFIAEDPARDGTNWFVYSSNDPVNRVDRTGRSAESEYWAWIGTGLIALGIGMMFGGSIYGLMSVKGAISEIREFLRLSNNLRTTTMHYSDGEFLEATARLFFRMIDNGEFARLGRVGMGAASSIAGYLLVLIGTSVWTEADFMDPHSPNQGVFGLF